MEKVKSDLRRAILPFLILSLLKEKPWYAYGVALHLQKIAPNACRNCDISTVFTRLAKDGLISPTNGPSPQGKCRLYYQITPSGANALEQFYEEFNLWHTYVMEV
ncbi:PadR family transcriptional regulator [Austwickia sp. TVS 96-490-7B]|uniref:PadR family transcriptional regulator n=1 Tax=Austwickia sp. TVS 96-490-7B TaxID=2830843 RepID=UPI00210357C3|nr:PadR family transcriptional regulator [Austwickia sp. TVS 96-490-7B]